ncbi:MAG: Bax inhibitor-1/YccA family protein [Eubacteriales bacterium]|nr:Bax inhibitor-1/YccA family protein [Eubacteriales bacterium]
MNQGYDPESFGVSRDSIASYTAKTFGWMFLGLVVTFAASLALYYTGAIYSVFLGLNGMLPFVLVITELIVVVYLSARIQKLSITAARGLFFLYALLNAVTFSSIFIMYQVSSLVFVFGMTAVYFGVMALYGYVTKADLSRIRPVLLFGLIALLVLAILSIFISGLDTGLCLVGVVIFIAFTAYDTQMIRRNYAYFQGNAELLQKASIISALQLYLDFINLFLYLLRLFGNRRN